MAEKKIIELEVKNNLGPLKSQLREAQAEVAKLSEQFGATSREAANAAKRAAELKDQIEDAKALTDAFNPDAKFKALSSSLGGVASGFAAYQGALGLVGVESKKVEEQLLKVQSAMALAEGLQALGGAKDSFIQLASVVKNQVVAAFATLKGALIATGIGALVVTIGFLLPKIMEWIDGTKELERRQNALNSEIDKANIKYQKNTEQIDKNTAAELRLARARGASEQELLNIEKKGNKERVEVQKRTVAELDKLLKDKRNMYIEAYVDEDWDRAKALNKEYKDLQAQRNAILKAKKDQNDELKLKQEELNITTLTKQKEGYKEQLKEVKDQVKKEEETWEESFNRRLKMQEDIDSMRLKPKKLEDDPNSATAKAISESDELMKIQNDFNDKKLAQLQKAKDDEKAIEEEAKNTKIRMAYDAFSVIQGVADLFAQGNEEDQRKAFQLNKAVNIGQAIMNTAQGVTAALSGGGNLGKVATGLNFVEAGLIGTIGALNIAKIANTQFQGGGGNNGGGNTPTATAPRTPSFDIIQAQPQMQLGALQQQPVKAYVVSGEVSTAQALDRNRVRNATF
jgi:chromosome segregation ATPase